VHRDTIADTRFRIRRRERSGAQAFTFIEPNVQVTSRAAASGQRASVLARAAGGRFPAASRGAVRLRQSVDPRRPATCWLPCASS
jgi:hypothetical protein